MSSSTTPDTDLGHMLSIKPLVQTSTFSSSNHFDKIGAGTCGTILTKPGTNTVFKLAKNKTTDLTGDLFNDFKWHLRVSNAMTEAAPTLNDLPRVPSLQSWISDSKEDWWNANKDLEEAAKAKDIAAPCDMICSERIDPLPHRVRDLLIDTYCPEPLRERQHKDPNNKDCLVRVYLGANKAPDGPRKQFFSLRNYKLHLNQMLEQGMDVTPYAHSMASALAVMHWKVGIDAKDVEFVIGLSPRAEFEQLQHTEEEIVLACQHGYVGPESGRYIDWCQRKTAFWLLDFNLCSAITMDDDGVEMAAKAWSINDPYYPKPLQEKDWEKVLWNAFVIRYIEASDRILGENKPELVELPRKFIRKIIELQREKMAHRETADL